MSVSAPSPVAPARSGPAYGDHLEQAVDALRGRTVAVLTGAGVSTDSGIPDYRGTGAPKRKPMTFAQFTHGADAQRRYWTGSHLGWKAFMQATPNTGHRALAHLERAGLVSGVITQNVDGLHVKAGTKRVVELHGTARRVLCLTCRQVFDRRAIGRSIDEMNPWITVPSEVELGPDGDVIPTTSDRFILPTCTICTGPLKPDVVFFGEYIPAARFREAEQVLARANALLVAGSSLVVNSGIRLVTRAIRRDLPIVIINRGPTKADRRATIKLDAGTSESLEAIASALTESGRTP